MPSEQTILAIGFAVFALMVLAHFLHQRREKRRAKGSRWATWRDEPWNHRRRRSPDEVGGGPDW